MQTVRENSLITLKLYKIMPLRKLPEKYYPLGKWVFIPVSKISKPVQSRGK